jgi:membrane AbrB-like protein
MKPLTKGLAALLIGGAGGALFYLLGAPLPWTLGSLAAAAVVSISGGRWLMPGPVRHVARPVVGVLAGSAFTPAVVASIGEWWGVVIFVVAYSLVITGLGWLFFRRLCKLDPVTAFFASTPGGLSELSLLGGSLGGNMATLVLIHSVRVVSVVFAVPILLQLGLGSSTGRAALPFAADGAAIIADWLILAACGIGGYGLAKTLDLPGGPMVAAMVLSAIVHGSGLTGVVPPGWLVALVQVVIGSVVGARFADVRWHEVRNTLTQAVVWCGVLLATAAAAAALGSYLFHRPYGALLLSLSPGGLAEMTIISYALGIEVAFIVTCHVVRSFSVMAFAPSLFRLCVSPGAKPPTGG